jgi:tetratricopeptide (TPR) repeat protein
MNEININEAKKMMEEGWKAREALEFDTAERLLNSAKSLFENESDWYNVTECLNHLSYSEKLKAIHALKSGLDFARESLKIAQSNGTKEVGVHRALFTLLMTIGNYEKALGYIEKYSSLQKRPEDLADAQTHKALCQLRMGNAPEALNTIDTALITLNKNESNVADPHISLWLVAGMLKKVIILYDLHREEESKKLALQALEIAKSKDLKTRIVEIEEFISIFD